MHYCAIPTGTTGVDALVQTADATTCASLGAVDVQLPTVLLPPLTYDDGWAIAGAVLSCWFLAWGAAFVIEKVQSWTGH